MRKHPPARVVISHEVIHAQQLCVFLMGASALGNPGILSCALPVEVEFRVEENFEERLSPLLPSSSMSPPRDAAEKKGIDRVITVTAAEAAGAALSPSEEAMCLMALCLLGPSGVAPVPSIRILVPTPQVMNPLVRP